MRSEKAGIMEDTTDLAQRAGKVHLPFVNMGKQQEDKG